MSSYIDHRLLAGPLGGEGYITFSWREHTRQRLQWIYGPVRANRIMRGVDPDTQHDIATWGNVGRRGAA